MPRRPTHRPVRRWPALWRRRCTCGVSWPCPDSLPGSQPEGYL